MPNLAADLETATSITTTEIPSREYPLSKDITYESEGVQYIEAFNLLNISTLPFITYVPADDWIIEQTENDVRISEIIKGKYFGHIEISFLEKGIDQQEAEQQFTNFLGNDTGFEKKVKDLPEWVVSSLFLSKMPKDDKDNWHHIWAVLGKHNDQYFYIYTYVKDEGIERFWPFQQAIFSEWRWKDTNEALGYSLN